MEYTANQLVSFCCGCDVMNAVENSESLGTYSNVSLNWFGSQLFWVSRNQPVERARKLTLPSSICARRCLRARFECIPITQQKLLKALPFLFTSR